MLYGDHGGHIWAILAPKNQDGDGYNARFETTTNWTDLLKQTIGISMSFRYLDTNGMNPNKLAAFPLGFRHF